MTKQEKYSELCELMDLIIKDCNPCGIEDGRCIASRNGRMGTIYTTCCRSCKHLGKNGCKEAILGCKFYFCGEAKRNLDRITLRRIILLEDKAIDGGFHLIVGEKENFDEPAKEMAIITGCEGAEGFKKTCSMDELEKVAKEIYASHPGENGYYGFTKYLWVLLPGAKEEVRLDNVVDYE